MLVNDFEEPRIYELEREILERGKHKLTGAAARR